MSKRRSVTVHYHEIIECVDHARSSHSTKFVKFAASRNFPLPIGETELIGFLDDFVETRNMHFDSIEFFDRFCEYEVGLGDYTEKIDFSTNKGRNRFRRYMKRAVTNGDTFYRFRFIKPRPWQMKKEEIAEVIPLDHSSL